MKQYKVEITREALQDMEDIYNYIAVDLLSPEKKIELRRILVDNYSVFYTISEDKVIVTNVLYMVADIEARYIVLPLVMSSDKDKNKGTRCPVGLHIRYGLCGPKRGGDRKSGNNL